MINFQTEYISAGGNRHPAAADWDPFSDLLAYGSDRNVALWKPLVRFTLVSSALLTYQDSTSSIEESLPY